MKKIIFLITIFCFLIFQTSFGAEMLGDANDNGLIDIIDALVVAQYYVGFDPVTFITANADVDGSATINIIDALLIAQYYVGLITEFPAQSGVEILSSNEERNLSPSPDLTELDSVVQGNNDFAFDIFGYYKDKNNNLFFSPVSVSFAFAMCSAGAQTNTETEIDTVMHFELANDRLHNAFNALEIELTTETENAPPEAGEELKIHIANSTWGQKEYYFVPDFLDILAINYGAGMNLVDFINQPEECRVLINEWVSDKTEQKINDLLPPGSINALTRLVLTNAIYFKANWRDPFDEKDTVQGSFTFLDGSTTSVPMMSQVSSLFYCEAQGEYAAIKLPYQGVKQNSMIIILPDEGNFNAFIQDFDNFQYNTILSLLRTYQVTLKMPKFEYEWVESLKAPLIEAGMVDTFDYMAADFSGINGERDLYIFDVFHKAFVSVDEKGTEAAAATAIVIGTTSVPEPATMTVDRPFLFIIQNDHTGAILFFGMVLKP